MAFDIVIGSDSATGFDIAIGDEDAVVVPTLASGTTLAALQAGSCSLKYTVAIEGYPYLLTDATPQQAIDAWSDDSIEGNHHYTQALHGLYVSMENQQQLDWRQPFPRGGHLTLHVAPDANDTFGVDTHKRATGLQTELRTTADRKFDQGTGTAIVTVASTTGWPTTGEAFIGTECFAYTGTTATTFTGVTRGKYAPLVGSGQGGWAEHHRVGESPLTVDLKPLVTSVPRRWIGKWVAVYLHKYDASIPAINSQADALVVFAGRIVSISDDPATGCTVVEVKHVLDVVNEWTIGGRDQYKGKIRNTIRVAEGMVFKMEDRRAVSSGATTIETADDLVCVTGASGDYEIEPDEYTHAELFQRLNSWWASALGDTDLHGTYAIGHWMPSDGTMRSYLWWGHSGAASTTHVSFKFSMPSGVANRLGWDSTTGSSGVGQGTPDGAGGALFAMTDIGPGAVFSGAGPHATISNKTLMRFYAFDGGGGTGSTATIDDETGTFVDQYDFIPSSDKPITSGGFSWGIFLVDNRFLAFGRYASGVISQFSPMSQQYGLEGFIDIENGQQWYQVPLTQNGPQDTDIRQIFVLEMPFGDALKRFIKSTGTTDYNDPDFDTLAYGLGVGIPNSLTNTTFLDSIDALPHAAQPIILKIDRAQRLSDILRGELVLRRAFLRWKQGGLEFATWKSPTETNSVGTLVEANKAAPAENVDHHRSVTVEDGAWAVPIQTIQYNRSLKGNTDGTDAYRDQISIVDATAVDDLGGDGPTIVINALGTLGDFAGGASVDSLAAGFMASMPFFSRPARRSARSIDQRFFETLSIGDIVAVTDAYARDPDTGQRGVATRYGIVTRVRYSLGGLSPNAEKPQPQGGDVDLFFLDVNRTAAYVPCAQIDDTATNGGYDDGTATITLYAHKHSESSEDVDAINFTSGHNVRIIEIDPADPADPLMWDREIQDPGNTDNELILTSTLSSPAWDATKKYRVIFDDYGDVAASQQFKTFQADDADALIEDTRVPYEYGIGGGDANYTAWSGSDPVELPPNAAYGDGVGRDVGHDVALARLVNNLISYKTGRSCPVLLNAEVTGSAIAGPVTWYCAQLIPINLSGELLSNDIWRRVFVAPFFKSTDGTVANCRITLSRTPPSSTSWFDVDRGSIYSELTFTTSSTTYATPTPDALVANVKSAAGDAYVYVEISVKCATYGLAHLQEGPILY